MKGEWRIKPGRFAHWYFDGRIGSRCALGPHRSQTKVDKRAVRCSHCRDHLRRDAKVQP